MNKVFFDNNSTVNKNQINSNRFFTLLGVLTFIVSGLILTVTFPQTSGASESNTLNVSTYSPDELEAGMKGYGRTVFEAGTIDTFPITVIGVLENVMPDQDFVLIRAETDRLEHTQIMSGMSGSPIFVDGHLIGALAYSWPFAKEPIAGVTPIRNIISANRRGQIKPGNHGMKKISTPLVQSGFTGEVQSAIRKNLNKQGMNIRYITGGNMGETSQTPQLPAAGAPLSDKEKTLQPGAPVGAQLMSGDLSLTAVGTVTHREDNRIYAFGHPFMRAGNIELTMTSAYVHSYMPSLKSSFKLASPAEPVGAIIEDRQAAVVGQVGVRPDQLPVEITLRDKTTGYKDSFHVDVVRNRYITPGLINSAAANFAVTKMQQQGRNWLESNVHVKLNGMPDIQFSRTRAVSGSFDPWTFLPIAKLWTNPFETPEIENITINLTLHHGNKQARITDLWMGQQNVQPGETVKVYSKIKPFRNPSYVKTMKLPIPDNLPISNLKLAAVPASKLSKLSPRPRNLKQYIRILNNHKSSRQLALILYLPQHSMSVNGNRLNHIPQSISGTLQNKQSGIVQQKRTVKFFTKPTNWVLRGSNSIQIPVQSKP
ncbi:MAG: hypothetical protein ABEK50_16220 [bacterium]